MIGSQTSPPRGRRTAGLGGRGDLSGLGAVPAAWQGSEADPPIPPRRPLLSSSSPAFWMSIVVSTVVGIPRRTYKDAPERFAYDYLPTLKPRTQSDTARASGDDLDLFGNSTSMRSPLRLACRRRFTIHPPAVPGPPCGRHKHGAGGVTPTTCSIPPLTALSRLLTRVRRSGGPKSGVATQAGWPAMTACPS